MTITFHVSTDEKLLIKAGQEVDFQSPLSKKIYTSDNKIHLAQKLQIPPENIFMHLTKVVGDEIKKGEILAKRKTLLAQKIYRSEYGGTIKEINHEEGSILISTAVKKEDVKYAYFKGRVEEVKRNEVTLKVDRAKVFHAKMASEDFGGEVLFAQNDGLERLTEDEVKNKVLFTNSIHAYIKVKFEVMGLLGVVTSQEVAVDFGMPHAILKSASDLNEIKNLGSPYCLASKQNNLIYLYQ